jgi:hypothetical protein
MERVQRNLMRRRVFIAGDRHLFIQCCDWAISVPGGSLTSKDIGSSSPEECLLDLEGQRLVSVESGSSPNSWRFQFDLGGVLELWPSAAYEPSDGLWSLHRWNGNITVMRNDGTMALEKVKPRG